MYLSIMIPLSGHKKCVLTVLKYASPVWSGIPKYLAADMQRVQISIIGILKARLPNLKELRDAAFRCKLEGM